MYSSLLIIVFCLTATGVYGFWNTILEGVTQIASFVPEVIEPEDAHLNINKLADKYGYNIENHTTTTEDGYVLTMHRMPRGKSEKSTGKVVFLMHGISESSDSWVLLGPDTALAYILADAGYDVWMGNARGTKHSIKHLSMNSTTNDYWAFSWDEIAEFDLPAMVDYALNYTNEKRLYYVGYSQGTTTFFALTSLKPEYNDKIELMFGLAPVVFMGNITNPFIRLLSPANNYLQYLHTFVNVYGPSNNLLNAIGPFVCNLLLMRCENLFHNLLGPNNVKETMWPVILGHMPTGTSTFQYMHYGQLVNSERFCRFDYGKKRNLEVYGRKTPPDYNLKTVTSPVILFYSGKDSLSNPRDVKHLIKELPNIKVEYFIKHFGHSDYTYAEDAKGLVYGNILKHLRLADFRSFNKTNRTK